MTVFRGGVAAAALAVLTVLTVVVAWPRSGPGAATDEASGGFSTPAALASNCPTTTDDPAGTVVISTFAFCPGTTSVGVGTEVTWTNHDLAPHTATGSFDSGSLPQGHSYTTRFDLPGTYPYYCLLHPGMRGTIVVTA